MEFKRLSSLAIGITFIVLGCFGCNKTSNNSNIKTNKSVDSSRVPIETSNLPAGEMPFKAMPPLVPGGPEQAFVYGNPEKTENGYFLKFSKEFPSPPHIHSSDYRGIVVKGIVKNGPDIEKAPALPAGSFWTQKAGESHITACVSEEPCMTFVMFTGKFDFVPSGM